MFKFALKFVLFLGGGTNGNFLFFAGNVSIERWVVVQRLPIRPDDITGVESNVTVCGMNFLDR